jgi:hypothetical protein
LGTGSSKPSFACSVANLTIFSWRLATINGRLSGRPAGNAVLAQRG